MADPNNRPPRRNNPDFAAPGTTGGLRPSATGQFNYVPPAREQGFGDAIKALSAVEPEISAIMEKVASRNEEKDKLAGTQRALETGGMTEEEAVKAGKLSTTDTTAFRAGFRMQYWRTQAMTWVSEDREALAKSGVFNSDDPKAAQTFLAQRHADRLKDIKDPYAREAALPILTQAAGNVIGAVSEYRAKRQMADHLTNFGKEASSVIDDVVAGRATGATAQARFADMAGRAKADGVDMTAFNEQLVHAIAVKAQSAGRASILELAKLHPDLANNPKYEGVLLSAGNSIHTRNAAQASLALAQAAHADRQRERQVERAAVSEAIAGGGAPIAQARLLEIAAISPSAAITARNVAKSIRDERREDDPVSEYQGWEMIRRSTNPHATLAALVNSGTIKGDAIKRLGAEAERVHNSPTASGMAEVDTALSEMDKQFRPGGPMAGLAARIDPKQMSAAKLFIIRMVDDAREANPNMSRRDVQKLADELVLEQTKKLEATAKVMPGTGMPAEQARDIVSGRAPPAPPPPPASPGGDPKAKVPAPPPAAKPAGAAAQPPGPPAKDYTKMTTEQLQAAKGNLPNMSDADVRALLAELRRRSPVAAPK